ncbi:hypothetical protein BcepSauron_370 [Burkholderia phage BcepSauron]|uniref:Uncharacterized protein n=2 Tax=Sarumanvirus TaxID=2843450 RepID=A0A482MNQ2_9CAUD|nr:hypothetical protein H1O16_gp367 [Burkholderia phage BcepSaruman]YP_009904748.1 hypothetical protein H1O17_gp370 [Burkholderia phage BcepSauron]QBQ74750.1 hypothetical protein BcepSauron_370 [Burkholderia phage BcepSauron]QBX06780.1 hypothetical protein BcepSaruman_367 [Burkholderia phage BcepSaruman]
MIDHMANAFFVYTALAFTGIGAAVGVLAHAHHRRKRDLRTTYEFSQFCEWAAKRGYDLTLTSHVWDVDSAGDSRYVFQSFTTKAAWDAWLGSVFR